MDFIVSHGTRSVGLPFSDAVRVGDILCLSGQIGHRPGTLELVPGGIEAETRQMMENIARILNATDRSFDDVFKCTVMLADMSEWREFNKVYLEYFKPSGCQRVPLSVQTDWRSVPRWKWNAGRGREHSGGHDTELTTALVGGIGTSWRDWQEWWRRDHRIW